MGKYSKQISVFTEQTQPEGSSAANNLYFLSDRKPLGFIRIIPAGREQAFKPLSVHYLTYEGSRGYYFCPARTALLQGKDVTKHPCAVCEALEDAPIKVVNDLKPRDRAIFYIIDGDNAEVGLKAFSISAFNAPDLLTIIDADDSLIDLEEGKIIEVQRVKNERGYRMYTFTPTDDALSLADEDTKQLMKETYFKAEEIYPVLSNDDIEKIGELAELFEEKSKAQYDDIDPSTNSVSVPETKNKVSDYINDEDSNLDSILAQLQDE